MSQLRRWPAPGTPQSFQARLDANALSGAPRLDACPVAAGVAALLVHVGDAAAKRCTTELDARSFSSDVMASVARQFQDQIQGLHVYQRLAALSPGHLLEIELKETDDGRRHRQRLLLDQCLSLTIREELVRFHVSPREGRICPGLVQVHLTGVPPEWGRKSSVAAILAGAGLDPHRYKVVREYHPFALNAHGQLGTIVDHTVIIAHVENPPGDFRLHSLPRYIPLGLEGPPMYLTVVGLPCPADQIFVPTPLVPFPPNVPPPLPCFAGRGSHGGWPRALCCRYPAGPVPSWWAARAPRGPDGPGCPSGDGPV